MPRSWSEAAPWRVLFALVGALSLAGWLTWRYVWHDADGCPRLPTDWADECASDLLIARYPTDPVLAHSMIRGLHSDFARDVAWLRIVIMLDGCPQYCNRVTAADLRIRCLERAEYAQVVNRPVCWALPEGEARLRWQVPPAETKPPGEPGAPL